MSSGGAHEAERGAALEIAEVLRQAGHQVVFAGGAVRDRLLGRPGHDIDIATSARPEQVMELFPETVPVGEAFGVVLVVHDGRPHDVATFRRDVGIADGRHPAAVEAATLEEDVRRRDYTVNGLVEDPFTGEVIDHVGGLADLEARRLRAIGEPGRRFREDALRLLRGVRFASVLGFEIEPVTLAAMQAEAGRLELVAPERVLHELERMLPPPTRRRAVELLELTGLLERVLPELAVQVERAAHGDDGPRAWQRLLETLDALGEREVSFELGLATLLLGRESADVDERCGRLRLSRASARRVGVLVEDQRARWPDVPAMRVPALRRFLAEESSGESQQLHQALCRVDGTPSRAVPVLDALRDRIGDAPLLPPPLLDGHELLELGVAPGPGLGELLRALEDLQLEGTLSDREAARAWVVRRLDEQPD